MALQRAYALLHTKTVDIEQRRFSGIATTPTPDRVKDVIEPLGVKFSNPLSLLLFHDHENPVGEVKFGRPTKAGVPFEASIPEVVEPGILQDQVNYAWQLVKYKLIRGVSIGFQSLNDAVEVLKSGGLRFLETEVLELSLVSVPAQSEAVISTIKQFDAPYLAALGTDAEPPVVPSAGVTASPVFYGRKAPAMEKKNYAEQITDLSNKRAAHEAQRVAIQDKATSDGRTKDEAEQEEFTTLGLEMKRMEAELKDLRELEASNIEKAVPIVAATPQLASDSRVAAQRISVRPNVPQGTAFVRMCMALARSKGDSFQAMETAKQWKDSTPEVELMVKAAIAAGSTTDATWASPLAVVQPLVNEFLELLRPRTLIGRIPGLKQVPFNVSVASQTTGGTYGWVGQNKPKAVTKADFATVTLTFAKAAGIIVLTEELVKLSTPSAEGLVREEMIAGMGQFLDLQFQDPAVAAVANVNPASITNGASTAAASGVTGLAAKTDLAASVAVFAAAGIPRWHVPAPRPSQDWRHPRHE